MRVSDLSGMRFGRLLATLRGKTDKGGNVFWHCLCDCGNSIEVKGARLKSEETRSCGCFQKQRVSEVNGSHRKTHSPEYRSWASMIARCENPKYHHFHRYGGRGIKICDNWRNSFENFLSDMGNRPSLSHTLDRINNDGNYEPANCRWATKLEQRHNQSRVIEFRRVME
jgi:hypothetical protein